MLKNKKAVYILIPLNIAVWSFFAYRFYTAYNETDVPYAGEKTTEIKIEDLGDSIQYRLSLDYKDPFLKGAAPNSKSHMADVDKKESPKTKVVKTATVAPKPVPDIKYLGLVKNSSSGKGTAIVALNGQSKLIKVNDVIDGITFKSFNKDSLVAKWGKEMIVKRIK